MDWNKNTVSLIPFFLFTQNVMTCSVHMYYYEDKIDIEAKSGYLHASYLIAENNTRTSIY